MKYIRELARADDNVMSVSPQISKEKRPFVGIVVICGEQEYCIPLTSPKQKHASMKNDIDFMKLMDGDKLLGALNFNNMIPVSERFITPIRMQASANDSPADAHYKKLLSKQLTFCQKNQDAIVRKANKLYTMVTSEKANHFLKKRCCDFRKLESVLKKYD